MSHQTTFPSRARARAAAAIATLLGVSLAAAGTAVATVTQSPSSRATTSRTALARGTWAITGATVVPMDRDTVLRDATVLVRDGRIAAVGPAPSVAVPAGARRIDGRGKFVIPGLADMHSHLYADEWVPDSVAPYELGVYLAHGVTTARLMIGTPLHHRLRRDIEAGRTVGPQLWIASPQFAGRADPNSRVVKTPAEARAAVRSVADSGYDFVKVTVLITRDVYDAIVDEARTRGIRVVGHVDPSVGVARALAAKQQIEHLDNYMESVLADSVAGRPSVSDVGAYRVANWETLDHVDDRKVEAVAGATARAGVFVTPTIAFFDSWFATRSTPEQVRARPDYAHIPARMREPYERAHARYWQNPPSDARRDRYRAVRNRMVKAIVDSGGRIMAGSDMPGGLMGYGWTMHRELAMLVRAGLTPMQALAAATRVPAEYIGATADWGTISAGKRADLVLLDADPLADITNTTRISAVSVGGRWMERAALDSMVEAARVRLNPSPERVQLDTSSVVSMGSVRFAGSADEVMFVGRARSAPSANPSVFLARRGANGTFVPRRALPGFTGLAFVGAVAPDGRTLYFESNQRTGSAREDTDIWVAEREGGGWGGARPLGAPFDSEWQEHYVSVSAEGTVCFNSDRPGGLGENDIYCATRAASGWNAPVNLGPAVNTPALEGSAYLDSRERFLLFASNGRGGGGEDIYISVRRDGAWQAAVPVRGGVNTPDDEWNPSLSPDGTRLLFTRVGGQGASRRREHLVVPFDASEYLGGR